MPPSGDGVAPTKGDAMLEEHGINRKYAGGDVIFKQGDSAKEMYIVRSGIVEIYRTTGGRETSLTKLKPSEFFGEMALFSDAPRSASAKAVGGVELQIIDKHAFMSLINEPVVFDMLKKMSDRIRQVDEKVEELSVQDQVRKEHLGTLTVRNSYFV